MNIDLTGLTPVQGQWVRDALGFCLFPFDDLRPAVSVEFAFDGAGAPEGHKNYMWAIKHTGNSYTVGGWPQNGTADDVNMKANPEAFPTLETLKPFFMESVIHELGHVLAFWRDTFYVGDFKEDMAPLFVHSNAATGEIELRDGTVDDWNPTGKPWEERIQEGVAEAFKDGYLPEAYRHFESRSNWEVPRDRWSAFLHLLLPCDESEGGGDS